MTVWKHYMFYYVLITSIVYNYPVLSDNVNPATNQFPLSFPPPHFSARWHLKQWMRKARPLLIPGASHQKRESGKRESVSLTTVNALPSLPHNERNSWTHGTAGWIHTEWRKPQHRPSEKHHAGQCMALTHSDMVDVPPILLPTTDAIPPTPTISAIEQMTTAWLTLASLLGLPCERHKHMRCSHKPTPLDLSTLCLFCLIWIVVRTVNSRSLLTNSIEYSILLQKPLFRDPYQPTRIRHPRYDDKLVHRWDIAEPEGEKKQISQLWDWQWNCKPVVQAEQLMLSDHPNLSKTQGFSQ